MREAFAAVEEITLGANQPGGVKTTTSVGNIISNFLLIMFIVGGLAVLVFILWGAMDWITAGGDKEKLSNARKKIVNSLIGLAILALAGFIVSLFGQIVGINPLDMGILPRLDDITTPATPPTP